MPEEHKYVLQRTGTDYTGVLTRDPDCLFPVPFEEKSFHTGIQEAVEELIAGDIRRFDNIHFKITTGGYYHSAKIISVNDGETILQISKLPYQGKEVYENHPVYAGIYLDLGKKTVKEFEAFSGFDFYFHNNYDPNSNYLELALIANDPKYGLGIYREFMTIDWQQNLENDKLNKRLHDNRRKYEVKITESPINSINPVVIRRYHFNELQEAFKYLLLSTDLGRMDPDLGKNHRESNWISEASLLYRHHGKVAELVAAKKFGQNGITSQPGIHLRSYVPVKLLERETKIDLSGLGNYGKKDDCLLVAEYFRNSTMINPVEEDFSRIIPHAGFTSLVGLLTEEKSITLAQNLVQQKKLFGGRKMQPPHSGGPKL
ncbi:hypothetical protein [Niabella sp.]|uniref:hypothetical protein n=1 Tax=Niabella sp. TaxID=1962976 RepID=UPI00260CD578|nr:hypothetical protein [Niabella sp.]